MNDLFSRMIARTSGAVSPLEPVLSSRYDVAAYRPPDILEFTAHENPEIFESVEPVEKLKPIPAAITPKIAPKANAADAKPRPAEPLAQSAAVPAPEIVFVEDRMYSSGKCKPNELTPAGGHAMPLPADGLRHLIGTAGVAEPEYETAHQEIIVETVPSRVVQNSIPQKDELRPQLAVAAASAQAGTTSKSRTIGAAIQAPLTSPAEINVTIGAIEVRVAPPPKPAVRKLATPRVSLDDYLRRRNGDTR
jgi:hypothetical protein